MDKNTSLDLTNITYELAKNSVEKTTENVQDSSTVVINLIINIMACPFTVLLNAMVIMAVKRRTILQTNSNILLACLAATDALTGLITQPAFIFWNTFEMTGAINYIPARLTYGTALRVLSMCSCLHLMSGAPNDNFRKTICSEDDLRARIFGTFVVKFLACLLLLGFSNI